MKKRLKLGLALGGGSARGLAHIGILKTLHKHKIYPDYIAGTSMGAVIGAMYASGYSPEQIEEIAKTTNWKKIVDFTVPKAGLIEGKLIENKIGTIIKNKQFKELSLPLRIVAYDFDKHQKVVFSKGDVTAAVRASISIPGIFSPLKIGTSSFIDGGIIDPTPFDVVKDMGADVIIAVDLFSKETKTVKGSVARESSLFKAFRKMFVVEELLNIKNYLIPTRWPRFIQKTFKWLFDKLLYPAKIIKIIAGKELPPIVKIMGEVQGILINNLAKERLKNADVDVKITPNFGSLGWADFNKVDQFVKLGEKCMKSELAMLKKKLK